MPLSYWVSSERGARNSERGRSKTETNLMTLDDNGSVTFLEFQIRDGLLKEISLHF